MRAADDLVAKTFNLDDLAYITRLETTLSRLLVLQWRSYARRAARRGSAAVAGGPDAVMNAVDRGMRKFADAVSDQIDADIAKIYQIGGKHMATRTTKRVRSRILKVDLTGKFDTVDRAAVQALRKNTRYWIGDFYGRGVSPALRRIVRETMIQEGQSRSVAADAIEALLVDKLRNITIPGGWNGTEHAYFEGLAAHIATTARVYGQLNTMREAMVDRYVITAANDERTCPVCSHMDGKEFSVDAGFRIADDFANAETPEDARAAHPYVRVGPMLALSPKPGNVGVRDSNRLASAGMALPPYHMRCFVPGTRVLGSFVGGSKAWYSGKVTQFITAKGRRLTVTPNHPVLTHNGWVAAGELCKGMQLLGYRGEARISLLGPAAQRNEDEHPTNVEDVFSTLYKRGGSAFVAASADDFHGDAVGFHGDVEVVGSYRKLLGDVQAVAAQQLGDLVLEQTSPSEVSLVRVGTLNFGLEGIDVVMDSFPSSSTLPLGRRSVHMRPFGELSSRPPTSLDAEFSEKSHKYGARDVQLFGELVLRNPGCIETDDLVSVHEIDFRGHVYDLQSTTGLVIASNVITSNCRCMIDIA